MSQKVVIKLLGSDVMDVTAPAGVEVEVYQYKADDQGDSPKFTERSWPGLVFTYAWPLSKAQAKRKRKRKDADTE